MANHVAALSRACPFQPRQLPRVQSLQSANALVHAAFVSGCLDYCNGLVVQCQCMTSCYRSCELSSVVDSIPGRRTISASFVARSDTFALRSADARKDAGPSANVNSNSAPDRRPPSRVANCDNVCQTLKLKAVHTSIVKRI